jgi:pimeloyl-ACP methyl ester carboxylesterase
MTMKHTIIAALTSSAPREDDMLRRDFLKTAIAAAPLGKAYPDVDWTNLFRKVGDLTKRPFDWSADVAKLQARTLLVFADADAIRPEHMVEFWKALGGGQRDAGIDGSLRPPNQLAIVPNTTHYTLPVDPMLPEIVERFLGSALKVVG